MRVSGNRVGDVTVRAVDVTIPHTQGAMGGIPTWALLATQAKLADTYKVRISESVRSNKHLRDRCGFDHCTVSDRLSSKRPRASIKSLVRRADAFKNSYQGLTTCFRKKQGKLKGQQKSQKRLRRGRPSQHQEELHHQGSHLFHSSRFDRI